MSAQREMSLKEFVGQLTPTHRARVEYDKLATKKIVITDEMVDRVVAYEKDRQRDNGPHECQRGCSFNPTSSSDFCDLHRPTTPEGKIRRLLSVALGIK